MLPILTSLLVGIVSGGTNYSRKISIDTAARDASRYAATLPVSNYSGLNAWLAAVADVAQQSAVTDLKAGTAGRRICVAYVYPSGTAGSTTDSTTMLVRTDAAGDVATAGSTCFSDASANMSNSTRRVQVLISRQSTLEAAVFSTNLTLSSQGLTKFEAF
ncbi:MAG: hypothetical protein JWO37_1516 [Acidimicrobiales bacterium]|nr:hypothetical protein [Acidimicrobiales bacterium]